MYIPAKLLTLASILFAVAGSVGLLTIEPPSDLDPGEALLGVAYLSALFGGPGIAILFMYRSASAGAVTWAHWLIALGVCLFTLMASVGFGVFYIPTALGLLAAAIARSVEVIVRRALRLPPDMRASGQA
jgi:hypothetical protein